MNPSLSNGTNKYNRGNGGKERICTTFTPESVLAIQKFQKAKGFLNEPDTIRFIVNAVLSKEGLLHTS